MSQVNLPLVTTVADFFTNHNWSGLKRESYIPPKTDPELSLRWTVAEFFSRQNWKGQPLTLTEQPATIKVLTTSVREFFYYIAWEGKPVVAARPIPVFTEPSSPDKGELNLNDLSDLF